MEERRRRGKEGLMGLYGVRELVHVEARGRRVSVDFMISSIICILSQIYYNIWDGYPKIINVFGSYFMVTCICITNKLYYLGLISQNY